MKKETKAAETSNNTYVILTGTVKKAYRGKTKFDEKVKNRVTLYNEVMPYELITAYNETPAKLVPSWYKDAAGYINAASEFEVPVMDANGKEIDFETWINDYDTHNANAVIKIRQKDGAIYLTAVKVLEDGEPVDAFEGM